MAVKVRRERADQRRHHRVTAPLFVTLNGQRVKAADWSIGGARLDEFPGEMPVEASTTDLTLTLPFQGFDVTFDAKAYVVRSDADARRIALRFVDLGERERELMSHFLEELVRGSMVEVEDTIQRIDVPVTPASLKPDAELVPHMPVRRWPLKMLVMSAFYVVVGTIVFGYAAVLTYTNFFRMEVRTAVITAPVETVTSTADGRVDWAGVKPGDAVKAGDVVVKLVDSQLQREIELAEIAVQERKAQLGNLKRRHLEELERVRGFAAIEMKNIEQTKLELQALAEQLEIATLQEQRLRGLKEQGYVTAAKLEDASRQVIALRKDLEVRRVELKARIELSEQNVGKRLYSGNGAVGTAELTGGLAGVEADIRMGEHEIKLAQQRYIASLRLHERLAVRAPFDGVVLDLPRLDSASVRRGDVIAVIEQRKKREITAWLNQDEILHVGLGDQATLFVPALNETLQAKVTRIDRTSGFVDEQKRAQNPGYRWRGPTDRTAKVTLAFADPDRVADADRYRSGLPVVVIFPQRSSNSVLASLGRGSAERQ
ncbi:MAG: HlyD family efflux transporter periplasmic adaptor subunit [Hyphomicrobiaceae bacterium]